MKKPYLIQRARFCTDPTERDKGLDRLLNFDYMGSAEFEWGALPKALERMRSSLGSYRMYDYAFKNSPDKLVTVYCRSGQEDIINGYIEELSENKIRLKERCDLSYYIKGDNHYRNNDFWWDIENDFMFWKHNMDFSVKFVEVIIEPVTK